MTTAPQAPAAATQEAHQLLDDIAALTGLLLASAHGALDSAAMATALAAMPAPHSAVERDTAAANSGSNAHNAGFGFGTGTGSGSGSGSGSTAVRSTSSTSGSRGTLAGSAEHQMRIARMADPVARTAAAAEALVDTDARLQTAIAKRMHTI